MPQRLKINYGGARGQHFGYYDCKRDAISANQFAREILQSEEYSQPASREEARMNAKAIRETIRKSFGAGCNGNQNIVAPPPPPPTPEDLPGLHIDKVTGKWVSLS